MVDGYLNFAQLYKEGPSIQRLVREGPLPASNVHSFPSSPPSHPFFRSDNDIDSSFENSNDESFGEAPHTLDEIIIGHDTHIA